MSDFVKDKNGLYSRYLTMTDEEVKYWEKEEMFWQIMLEKIQAGKMPNEFYNKNKAYLKYKKN